MERNAKELGFINGMSTNYEVTIMTRGSYQPTFVVYSYKTNMLDPPQQ